VAAIDIAGFIADVKGHAIDHGFHVHDERHFVETYSLRQLWEIDLHPEEACSGPMDLHVSLEADPRVLLNFEDLVLALENPDDEPGGDHAFALVFTWAFPPLTRPPDLLILATEVAGLGGHLLPLEVSAIDSFHKVTDAAERSLSVVGRYQVPLAAIYRGDSDFVCDLLDACQRISLDLLERAPAWIED
jgi:hypothetical protein